MLLARRHIAIRRTGIPLKLPDLALIEDTVAPRILEAMRTAAAQLKQARIPFALVGGLAIGAHGHPRATRDIDFLLGDEAFALHPGGIVTLAAAVPIQVQGVAVDALSIRPDEPHLRAALAGAPVSQGIPILPLPALVYLKLRAGRLQDLADVVALLRTARPGPELRAYLATNAPELLPRLEELESRAEREE